MTGSEQDARPAEATLAASLGRGEDAGWEAAWAEHQGPVFRLAYLLLGDSAEAEDAAQEAFIRAYQARARYDPRRPLRPWLLRITANVVRNRQRRLGRYLGALQRLLWAEPPPAASVESLTLQQVQAQSLWQAVRRLSAPDQEVIYLRFFLELPEAELAAALSVAPGTVKSRLHRALGRLRAVIERDYPELHERWPL